MLVHEELTQQLIKGFFDVHNEVGLGRNENDYHQALCVWLGQQKIQYACKPARPILLDGVKVMDLYPDLVVNIAASPNALRMECRLSPQVPLLVFRSSGRHIHTGLHSSSVVSRMASVVHPSSPHPCPQSPSPPATHRPGMSMCLVTLGHPFSFRCMWAVSMSMAARPISSGCCSTPGRSFPGCEAA